MANRARAITLRVPVTEQERELIEQKMKLIPTKNFAAYAGKMLVSSFGCSYETADIEFEYTLSQAIDKGHIHNHILFCDVKFVDHHKYKSNKRTYYNIRNTSDRLCKENGCPLLFRAKEARARAMRSTKRKRRVQEGMASDEVHGMSDEGFYFF